MPATNHFIAVKLLGKRSPGSRGYGGGFGDGGGDGLSGTGGADKFTCVNVQGEGTGDENVIKCLTSLLSTSTHSSACSPSEA